MTLVDLVADLDYSVPSMLHFQEGKLQRPPIVALLSDDDDHDHDHDVDHDHDPHHDHDHDADHDHDPHHGVDHDVDDARFPSWKGCDIHSQLYNASIIVMSPR